MRLASIESIKLPNFSIRLMATILRERGLDVAHAVERAAIPGSLLTKSGCEVTGLQELAFQRAFFELTPEMPLLWIELGSRYRLLSQAHDIYGLSMATSASVQQSLEVGYRFGDLYYTLAKGTGIYAGPHLVGFRSSTEEIPPDLRRFSMLRDLGTNCSVLSDLLGEPFPFENILLPLPASDDCFVRQYLPHNDITYDAPHSEWRWSIRIDQRRPPQTDRMLHDDYSKRCESIILAARSPIDFVEHLVALIAVAPEPPTICEAAHSASLSVRTLQRRLEALGLSYRDLIALGRYRAACHLLAETRLPINQVAIKVGYESASSFNHAFRRHAGVSPRSYRNAA